MICQFSFFDENNFKHTIWTLRCQCGGNAGIMQPAVMTNDMPFRIITEFFQAAKSFLVVKDLHLPLISHFVCILVNVLMSCHLCACSPLLLRSASECFGFCGV